MASLCCAGRKGKTGIATTFINKNQSEQILLDLKHLLKEAKQRIPPVLQALHDPMEELAVRADSGSSRSSTQQWHALWGREAAGGGWCCALSGPCSAGGGWTYQGLSRGASARLLLCFSFSSTLPSLCLNGVP